MSDPRIGIVGYGYVGRAVCRLFERYCPIHHDTAGGPDNATRDSICGCDVVFVCVPTQMGADGRLDVSAIDDVAGWLEGPKLVILKSTVPVGTTESLPYPWIFSPEYVGESSYWTEETWHRNMIDAPWYVFGGPRYLTDMAINLYLPICGPQKRYIQTDSRTAELAKLAENSLYAAKVMLWHELARIADAHQLSWHELREVILADPRQTRLHTGVWGDGKARPFGGKCFPKDLSELIDGARAAGYCATAFAAIRFANDTWGSPAVGSSAEVGDRAK